MAYITPTLPETLEDRERYTRSHLQDVSCRQCLARVQVRKNSTHHTSIQWTQEAVSACQTFASLSEQEGGRPVHTGCPQLLASIDQAVHDGAVQVGLTDE